MPDAPPEPGGLYATDRARLRQAYRDAWRKRRAGEPLEPLEVLIATVVEQHPEYHPMLARDDALDRDFLPGAGAVNPYLHMGLHLAVQEQVATDRPVGVRGAYQALVRRLGSPHQAEHAMMDCLAAWLWEGQRGGRPPEEAAYRDCLEQLVRG
jgi:hypothetical protein